MNTVPEQHDSERSVEQLMKFAGERELPSAAAMESARAAAIESWQRMLVEKPPRRWLKFSLGFAAAAGSALVAIFVLSPPSKLPPPSLVARVVALEGSAVVHAGARYAALGSADAVFSGAILETHQGRIALLLGDALSLRMDRHTRVRIDAAERVALLEGSVYVDSGGINARPDLRIETPAGEVRHVGTQFLVSVADGNTRIRVREGRVSFMPPDAARQSDITAGDELRIVDGNTQLQRGLPSFGADWEWTAEVAPPFDIESRPLAEFLAWMTREHGWQLRYASETLQQRTYEIRLHGVLDQSSADAMVERVSLITGVPLQARDGVLWIGAPR